MHFSACADGLTELLRAAGPPAARRQCAQPAQAPAKAAARPERNTIVMAGCEAHVCLLQTALDLLDEEFEVWVVTDACSSRTERNRDAAFDRLAGAGAELVTTEMVAFEWLRTAEHPLFKDVLEPDQIAARAEHGAPARVSFGQAGRPQWGRPGYTTGDKT